MRESPSPAVDFPFYNGRPVGFSAWQWLVLMVAVAFAFKCLTHPVSWFNTPYGQFVPAILFFAIPLGILAVLTPKHWTALFRKVGWREVLWMLAFSALNLVVTVIVAIGVSSVFGANPNPAAGLLAGMGTWERVLFFLKTLPQLLGEEIISILPFLAIMWLLHAKLKTGRTTALAVAWVVSALLFGMAHLPTYGWNWAQCLIVIGIARVMLTLAYVVTKNLWVSTGTHILNDWVIFLLPLFLTSLDDVPT